MRPTSWIHAAFVAAILLPAVPAFAGPSLRLSWDQCDPVIVNRDWSGPGPYVIQISGTGFAGTYNSMNLGMVFLPHPISDAWDFSRDLSTRKEGCQGLSRVSASNTGGGCPAFPGQVTNVDVFTSQYFTHLSGALFFDQSFVADPNTRYAFLRYVFDHGHSVVGPAGAGECGNAEQPMCLRMGFSNLASTTNFDVHLTYEQEYVSWQDPANGLACLGVTPAQAKTWGAIKASYR